MAETIAEAVEQIKSTMSLRNLDESATKQGVVLRLLSLAGWNPFDLSDVVPEYTVGNRRVDFALRPGSTNSVFIEVKRPSENLENHQQQLLEYCFQEGVKLAALTNGRTWWLYLPLQPGSWEQRRFLTIDLESQEPNIVEQRFMEYLSRERVVSGRAASGAEDLVQSQQRAEITRKAIVEAWNQIVDTPDEILVDLISETAERICGFKPEPKSVERFLSRRVHAPDDTPDASPPPVQSTETEAHSETETQSEGQGPTLPNTLPITLDPSDSADFREALMRTKRAWFEESYSDGRKEVRPWNAQFVRDSTNVLGNVRSRPRYKQGRWQKEGLVSLHVSIDRPRSEDA